MDDSAPKSGPLSLNFHVQPPENPFKDVYFPVQIFLQESDGEPKFLEVPLEIRLYYRENPKQIAPEELFEIEDPGSLYISREKGYCEANVRIKTCSMEVENREFMLCCSVVQDRIPPELQGIAILETHSSGMKVMRHRLRIDEDNLNWEETWYKDEGGRDKCIEIPVRLENSKNELVTNRKLKVKISLVYAETLYAVTDQTILKVFLPSAQPNATATTNTTNGGTNSNAPVINKDDTQHELWTENGLVNVRIRIEDVSKNHQGQNFRIKIAPDTRNSPGDFDVMLALSHPVTVRSKRNKRRAQTGNTAYSIQRVPSGPSPLGGLSTTTHSATSSADALQGVRHLTGAGSGKQTDSFMARSASFNNNTTAFIDQLALPSDRIGATLREALTWISECRAAFREIEWSLIGYESDTNSRAADPGRPLYKIQNPNSVIHHLARLHDDRLSPLIHALPAVGPNKARGSAPYHGGNDYLNTSNGSDEPLRRRQRTAYDPNRLRPFAVNDGPGLSPPELTRDRNSIHVVMDALNETQQGQRANNNGDDRLERLSNAVFDHDHRMNNTSFEVSPLPPLNRNDMDDPQFQQQQQQQRDDDLAPPTMLRGVSSLFVGSDQGTVDRSMTMDPVPPLQLATGAPELAEQNIRVVIAKRFKPNRPDAVALGFPAFDAENHLVGLYREIQTGSSTQIVFVAATDADSGLKLGDASTAVRAYEREIANKSDSIHDIAKFGSIERLKEAVAIYHWSKEAFANDLDSRELSQQEQQHSKIVEPIQTMQTVSAFV